MPSQLAKKRPLSAVSSVPTPEPAPEVTRGEPTPYVYCFGTGMEMVVGRGTRSCREQERQR
jgi:hypothetical protein